MDHEVSWTFYLTFLYFCTDAAASDFDGLFVNIEFRERKS
jgi:hypothetical protein